MNFEPHYEEAVVNKVHLDAEISNVKVKGHISFLKKLKMSLNCIAMRRDNPMTSF